MQWAMGWDMLMEEGGRGGDSQKMKRHMQQLI